MGTPDWGAVCREPRGKGPRTKKKRNALRNAQKQEQERLNRLRKVTGQDK